MLPPGIAESELVDLAAEIKSLVSNASDVSTRVSKSVNLGNMLKRLAPCFAGFPCGHHDCRHLGDPIDYIAFNGLTCAGRVDSLLFLEVKSGAARLKGSQTMVQRNIDEGRVDKLDRLRKGVSMSTAKLSRLRGLLPTVRTTAWIPKRESARLTSSGSRIGSPWRAWSPIRT
jgi:hypothetical protein